MRQVTKDALRDSLMNRTVLVIDDNEAVRTAFEVLLSIHGVRRRGCTLANAEGSSPSRAMV